MPCGSDYIDNMFWGDDFQGQTLQQHFEFDSLGQVTFDRDKGNALENIYTYPQARVRKCLGQSLFH